MRRAIGANPRHLQGKAVIEQPGNGAAYRDDADDLLTVADGGPELPALAREVVPVMLAMFLALIANPLVMDTAKASIDKAKAINKIVIISILKLS